MTAEVDSTHLEHKILVEQVKLLYRSLLPILAVNLVVSLAMLYGLWNVVSQTALTIWMSVMTAILAIRLVSFFVYRSRFRSETAKQYVKYFIIGTTVTGLMWGVGCVVLFPAAGLEYQLFILFILVGMGAGAVSSLTTLLPAFYAYFIPSMTPYGVMLLFVGDPIHLSLGIMSLAYIIALSYFGMNINRNLIQSLRLRFENIDLVEQLRQQKDEAELANISKSKFLAAASHDLRQPLHALTLFTSVLDESIQYPKVRRVVDQIKASVQALQSLFDALLDISRLDAGVMEANKRDFPLNALFKKLANDFNLQATQKGLHIFWPTESFAVHSDPALLEQILRNYISNAIRYTPKGEIRVSCEPMGDELRIDVADTGPGIPGEELQAIFEEFHQLSNPERDRSKGLGLGLAIVQRTAALLGHSVNVESTLGEGSVFSIAVEKADVDQSVANILAPSAAGITNSGSVPVLIIVVDDEVSVLEGTQSLLQLWDCEVITAVDKKDALEKLSQQHKPPDGIIADYRLREDQTGIDVIHAIHDVFNENIPALITTGDIAADRLREVNNSGFQVLHKPVAPLKLRTFLRNVQNRQAMHQF